MRLADRSRYQLVPTPPRFLNTVPWRIRILRRIVAAFSWVARYAGVGGPVMVLVAAGGGQILCRGNKTVTNSMPRGRFAETWY